MTTTATSFAIPSAPTSAAHWLGRGKQLCVQGLQIESPFVFAGRRLSGPWCTAVDVELPARLDGLAGRPGASAYAHLTSRQRFAYLNWLAGGRRGKLTEQTLLVTFLAGAEQYLLGDDISRTMQDESDLLDELLQLATVYRTVYAELATQCVLLRDYAWVRRHARAASSVDALAAEHQQLAGIGPTLALRWVAGIVLAQRKPLPVAVAYQFARTYLTGNEFRRLPLYETQFQQLFRLRFAERFGKGLPVPDANLNSEVISYAPVGASMLGQRTRLSQPVPLFVGSNGLRLALGGLVASCMNQLKDFIEARMEGVEAEAAWTKLPVGLWPTSERDAFRKLVGHALQEPTVVTYEQIAPYFVAGPTLTEKNMNRLVDGLAQLGLATYPQMPFQKPNNVRSPVVLYEQDTVSALNELADPAGESWPLALRLAVSEKGAGRDEIGKRLNAYVQCDATSSLELRRQRRASLVWAGADAWKPVTKVQWAKTAESLQQDATDLLGILLAPLNGLSDTPMLDSFLGARWMALKTAPLRLDLRRVQQLTAETSAVTQLLGDLFSETPAVDASSRIASESVSPVVAIASGTLSVSGPAARREFIRRLTERAELPELELFCLAAELSLMAEGTVDWANELAYDVTSQPLLEESPEGWFITPGVAQVLLQHLDAT